jgi:hypothetical protein
MAFVMATLATLLGIAIPPMLAGLDDARASSAARHLAAQLGAARFEAVRRSTFVGLRFQSGTPDYVFTKVVDGNENGLRTSDIARGVDRTVTPPAQLAWDFPGVTFGLLPGVPGVDGPLDDTDGIHVGVSGILSMNPNGTSSSGTLYLHGRKGTQYAVRVLGATGRVRVLEYQRGKRQWVDR